MCVCVCTCVCVFHMQGANGLEHRLVYIPRPILKVPNLCIHLCREMNKSFGPNPETQMCGGRVGAKERRAGRRSGLQCAIVWCHIGASCALCVCMSLCAGCPSLLLKLRLPVRRQYHWLGRCGTHTFKLHSLQPVYPSLPLPLPQPCKHHPLLMKLLCEQLKCSAQDVVDFELCLTDTQPAVSLCL